MAATPAFLPVLSAHPTVDGDFQTAPTSRPSLRADGSRFLARPVFTAGCLQEPSAPWRRFHVIDSHREERRIATDYDAPRVAESDDSLRSRSMMAARRRNVGAAVLDVDDGDGVDPFELPDADVSGEEPTVRVFPKQADEFTCSRCFLVQHRNRLAMQKDGRLICADCI